MRPQPHAERRRPLLHSVLPGTGDDEMEGLTSVVETNPPCAGEEQGGEEEVARIHIYREYGPTILTPMSKLAVGGPRPPLLPPALDRFLWGGLSVRVHEALTPLLRQYLRKVALCFVAGYMVALVPLLVVFGGTEFGGGSLAAGLAALYAGLCLAGTILMVRALTHALVPTLHHELEGAVCELSPHFRRVGYDLQYGIHKTGPISLYAFVRIVKWVPTSEVWMDRNNDDAPSSSHHEIGEGSGSDSSSSRRQRRGISPGGTLRSGGLSAESVPAWRPLLSSSHMAGDDFSFRVAVTGRHSSPQCRRQEHEFHSVRNSDLQAWIDPFTWGAIASELKPLSVEYSKARLPVSYVTTLVVPLILGYLGYIVALQVYLFGFCIAGANFESFVPERLLGQQKFLSIHHRARDLVRDLAPSVSERSGHELEYVTEYDGCGCASGYVVFRKGGGRESGRDREGAEVGAAVELV